jgi:hypothetical protein
MGTKPVLECDDNEIKERSKEMKSKAYRFLPLITLVMLIGFPFVASAASICFTYSGGVH